MDAENKQVAQELSEQELEYVSGAGKNGGWECPFCHHTEFEMVERLTVNGYIPMMKCKKCHTEM